MHHNDPLQIYGGKEYIINKNIKIHHPTLGEIRDFGEQAYYGLIQSLTATPTDMKYQLYLEGKDWNQYSDFELFMDMCREFTPNRTKIIFGDLELYKYKRCRNLENGEKCLYDNDSDSIIDRSVHELMASYLRKMHGLQKNEERAMNEFTKKVLLEEAEENYNMNKGTPFKSVLLPLISSMSIMCGWDMNSIWRMEINVFMDAVKRIKHVKNADLLLQSGSSAFGIDLNKLKNKNKVLNYFEELE